MHYKTIVLELLKTQKELHDHLRIRQRLLPTLEFYAQQLKDSHETWKETLSQVKQNSDPGQINSQALELAISDLEERLHYLSPQDDGELPTLDSMMAYLLGHISKN